MNVVVALLRGVNVGGHHQIRMEVLRGLCEGLGLYGAQTYVQSGNVVFRTAQRSLAKIARQLGNGVEELTGFRPGVMLRTAAEMADVMARNPFAGRTEIEPGKLAVLFLTDTPSAEGIEKALGLPAAPEEFRVDGREVYIYFPNGMGRPKLSVVALEKALGQAGTARNWNTVTKLCALVSGSLQSSSAR